ncbi:glycosyltransferase family 4 protein [Roseicella aquatilis]|uniref:Glycosyltransferase n=1 Tax=Roseicella aquatilis TaxID=2527868 RepID=A0A4R4DP34_9PROT|nr:glycosyltransferase family 4 protein [Roseicella aquatilis]TCZ63579.1 glycosyltransferase [Roseicella aquatilis]
MRVLFLCHNHPALQPGGTEVFARSLFRALRDRHGVEGLFLAAVTGAHRERRPGTLLQGIGDATDEALVWLGHLDRFNLAQPDTYGLASLAPVIEQLQPDLVHVHHLLQFGVETVDMIRRAAPKARLVFTAHDFFPLCPQEGQLLTTDGRLCPGPSLDRCQACFPGRAGADFVMRELQMRDVLGDFDRILTPSDFARGRYIAAGTPAAQVQVMRNGIAGAAPAPHRTAPDGRRDRFGFFGHVNRFKGGLVLLDASRRLSEDGVAHGVTLHGGAAYQSEKFMEGFTAGLAAAPEARHAGPYAAAELPGLMAQVDWVVVPSVWWENAPLVIQEAHQHRRPVICGDAGGMAEMVRDGVDGLHAPIGDAAGLARVMRRAIETEGLWERLAAATRPPTSIEAATLRHLELYRDILGARAA